MKHSIFFHNIQRSFQFERFVVRLGEYDLRTEDDGPHEDILIDRAVPHASYHELFGVNDIAMIYLEHDVEFNGKTVTKLYEYDFHFQSAFHFAYS